MQSIQHTEHFSKSKVTTVLYTAFVFTFVIVTILLLINVIVKRIVIQYTYNSRYISIIYQHLHENTFISQTY